MNGEKADAISFENVTFTYNGAPVLEDVKFSLEERTFVSVVGPNGGGKTTMLKLILGILKPTRGEVKVFGCPPEKVRQCVGYMPQHMLFDPKFPMTVMDVVLMGRLGKDTWGIWPYRKKDKEIALETLDKVGMVGYEERLFMSLSGGERQRVLIARALATEPRLLLLDEPTTNVDVVAEGEIFKLLDEMSREITVVVVSHDLGFVSQFVKKVICVNRRVVLHPTDAVTGDVICSLYGADVHIVRHGREG
ncbi:MAG: ABC transporter ATP-binding protein [Syntrophales bacterium]|nr:ABC transporter ATP-binding protein [Syntrophales bacterium]